jgi:hypothetical protein
MTDIIDTYPLFEDVTCAMLEDVTYPVFEDGQLIKNPTPAQIQAAKARDTAIEAAAQQIYAAIRPVIEPLSEEVTLNALGGTLLGLKSKDMDRETNRRLYLASCILQGEALEDLYYDLQEVEEDEDAN